MQVVTLDVKALNQSIKPMVQALFWGAVATAVVLPIAGAIGTVVGSKVEKKWSSKEVKT